LQVKVHLHGILRDQLPAEARGRATLDLDEGATIGDLLNELSITRRVVVALNDEEEPNETRVLSDGDQVVIFTMIGGGSVKRNLLNTEREVSSA
jgi:thiamine biosynthesis protein ThiS